MWTCLGFVTSLLLSTQLDNPSTVIIIGSYNSQTKCDKVGRRWERHHQMPNFESKYICEQILEGEEQENDH